jgi:hypothetical protein
MKHLFEKVLVRIVPMSLDMAERIYKGGWWVGGGRVVEEVKIAIEIFELWDLIALNYPLITL